MELRDKIDIRLNGTTMIIGEIMHVMLKDGIVASDGYTDHVKGRDYYRCRFG